MLAPLRWARKAVNSTALGVAFVEFFFRRQDASGDIYPDDAGRGIVDGPAFDRIVIVGEGTAIGLGVSINALAMGAQLARKLSHATGKGVHWTSIGLDKYRLGSAPALIRDTPSIATVDLVIVMAGITDTLLLTSRRRWERAVEDTLAELDGVLSRDAVIVFAEIPPMDNAGSISRAARAASGHHAAALNKITRRLVFARKRVLSVAFPRSLREELWLPESRESPYANMYAIWANALVTAILDERGIEPQAGTFPA
jgi:hypothetical protein